MPVGDFPTISHDTCILIINRTVTSENGIIHTYTVYALYILHICTCTFILDVRKRGVLDRRMTILYDIAFFLHILSILVIM